MSSGRDTVSLSGGPIVRCGHVKKLKTQKKKYFVLRGEAPGCPACLEYYDSKKKFDDRQPPKRSILLDSCYNINKRVDTKYKHVIALYTKNECFCLILENEKELDEWLKAMLTLQSGNVADGEEPRPIIEHVWRVTISKRGLGKQTNIHGPYRLCLTDGTLSLIKVGAKDNSQSIEFPLICIRRCGGINRVFYLEMGRSAVTGGGEFWMEVEDNNIAHNMQLVIMNAMQNSNSSKDDIGPRQRMRSSSATEASKPILVSQRRHTGQKLHNFSPLEEHRTHKEQVDRLQEQEQCNQTQSSPPCNTVTAVAGTGAGTAGIATTNANCATTTATTTTRRRHSVASHPHSVNNSQSVHITSPTTTTTTTTTSTIITTATATTTTTTTATISHQRTLSLPLAAVIINQTQSSKRSVLRCANGRDRCDSLPSRARTTSEGHPATVVMGHPRGTHFAPHVPRPHSMYGKGLSYSPPVTSMPISPASGACSTDSAGSSLSMDDGGENMMEEGTVSRYGHSLTPDEPVILEENGDDYAPWPISHSHHKYSPNFKSHSPSQQSSYIEMYSPCGSSPGRGAYMPMSGGTAHSHSRASSLVEEANTLPDGYVPMAPVGNNGYVDMDPTHNHNGHFPDDMSQHGGSSCSVTSGTPSTDLRFSEYQLDKVSSFLPSGDDLQARPARAYSIGSRPEPVNRHQKNRLEIAQQEASRVRAFSVGSRFKRPEMGRLASVVTAPLPASDGSSSNKSNSAPLLSSSWGHNSGCSGASERMEDLMELDFTRPSISTTFNSPPSSYSQSHSQSQSYSTATDTSSYVDMSPGQPPTSTTAPYVDMSRMNKINRNNNNNTITANQNHSHIHVTSSASVHKPVITTLQPVEEAEGPYMTMDGGLEDWSHQSEASPKQISSPPQEDSLHMSGPPGGQRTAPVDLPRRPSVDYVEMNFKSRANLEQDYINMNMGSRNNGKTKRAGSLEEKSRSQPIAIQSGNKPAKAPSFLPLNGSPESESLASTPASPPRATPTGSSATIFPFSLNSPQSPEKSFNHQKADETPGSEMASTKTNDVAEPTKSVPTTESCPSSKAASEQPKDSVLNTLAKKFSDLSVSKPRLITASPNTSPTLSGFKQSDETTPTPTPTPSPLENDSCEKSQPAAAENLHYASLDLPEIGNAAPVSPASQEGFNYAEIDFAKLKQN